MFALSSLKSASRLEQIAALRARGIGNHINLPQLVVSGDQSVGKSSVLEGLTGLPFPRKDGLCTRWSPVGHLLGSEPILTWTRRLFHGARGHAGPSLATGSVM